MALPGPEERHLSYWATLQPRPFAPTARPARTPAGIPPQQYSAPVTDPGFHPRTSAAPDMTTSDPGQPYATFATAAGRRGLVPGPLHSGAL